jgi:uncharacterized protein (DUF2141 family)
MIKKILFLKILLLLLLPARSGNSQTVEVIITGIRSEKGQIVIGVFKDDESFQKEESFMEKRFVKSGISNRERRVQFSLQNGI